MTDQRQRDLIIDYLKGFAIFLVVWGHCIQCLGEGYDTMNQPIGKFIYMFHMPLFFFCSGIFHKSIIKSGWREFIIKRWHTLLVPTIIWSIISSVLFFIFLEDNYGVKHVIYKICTSVFEWYWFIYVLLLSIIVCKTMIWISSKIGVNKWYLLIFSYVIILLVPKLSIPFSSYIDYLKGFYIFYLLGWCFSEFNLKDVILRRLTFIFVTSCVLMGGGYYITPRTRMLHLFYEYRFYKK